MRIRISLSKDNFSIPIAYQSILQGTIYALLSKTDIGYQYHEVGYQYLNKKFKCFVFSQLFGKYSIQDKYMIFKDQFYFYISSQDENFLREIYNVLLKNEYLILCNEKIKIEDIYIFDIQPFSGIKKIDIKMLSPLLIYSTKDNYSTYYKPSDSKALDFIIQNIKNKSLAYGYPINDIVFRIKNVQYEKKRMIKFKECFYPSYLCQMEIETNYETLSFIYNCGLSSKNSCGFGMIEVIREKSHILI
ncbi:MAG: CRISPR-associated endoribonuclease Cas6 [Massilimicrobiota timonensis]|mgnify:CR=1 FL=1